MGTVLISEVTLGTRMAGHSHAEGWGAFPPAQGLRLQSCLSAVWPQTRAVGTGCNGSKTTETTMQAGCSRVVEPVWREE